MSETDLCPDCNHPQFSPMDKKYLEMFKTCWSCDEKRWEDGTLVTEVFEEREAQANAEASN